MANDLNSFITPFLVTLVVTILSTFVLIRLAPRLNCVAKPTSGRWHTKETPLLGGVAIFVGYGCGVISALLLFEKFTFWSHQYLLLATASMFLMGLIDDIYSLKPFTKFAFQSIAALAIVLSLGAPPLLLVALLLWILAITNAINLLDNIDGLAAATISTTSLFLFFVALNNFHYNTSALLLLLALATFVFYLFNKNPAQIFMGDAGSQFAGFSLAVLAILSASNFDQTATNDFILLPFLFAIPIFDTSFVSITRLASGRKISQGGRDHISHRIVALGLTEKTAVSLLITVSLSISSLAMIIYNIRPATLPMLLVGLICIFCFCGYVLYTRKD